MSLSNSIRELLFKQQEINNPNINLKPKLRTITDTLSIEQMFSENMIKNQHKIIELSKKNVKSLKSKSTDIILDKLDEISDDISEYEIMSDEESEQDITDIKKSYKDLDHPTDDIEFIKPDIVDNTLISPDIETSEIDISDNMDGNIVEDFDREIKDVKIDIPEDLSENSTKKSSEKSSEKMEMSGGKMDGLLFECLNKIHLKGGNTPNLTQNFEMPKKESVGGGEFKKIHLTEKYDFF